jgi:hypothetical protein
MTGGIRLALTGLSGLRLLSNVFSGAMSIFN